ncbi:MAG: hypothetical protein JXJ17_10905 [Anaerolineae bacterium]|nr:hypothetical protein [Anaerolineae bacterium]
MAEQDDLNAVEEDQEESQPANNKPRARRTKAAATPDGGKQATAAAPVVDSTPTAASTPTPPTPTAAVVPPPPGGPPPAAPRVDYSAQIAADQPKVTFGDRVGRFVRRMFAWVFVLIIGALLGAALFFFVPQLYRDAITPLADNTGQINSLQSDVDTLESNVAALEAAQAQAEVDQESAMLDSEQELSTRLAESEQRLAEAEQRVADLEARLRDAEQGLDDQDTLISDLGAAVDQLSVELNTAYDQIAQLQEDLPGVAEYAEYDRQLLLIRAWQGILRARIQLQDDNAGLARNEIEDALDLLNYILTITPDEEKADLQKVIDRLSLSYDAIEESPFTASADLEVAWYTLGEMIGPVNEDYQPPVDEEAADAGEAVDEAEAESAE